MIIDPIRAFLLTNEMKYYNRSKRMIHTIAIFEFASYKEYPGGKREKALKQKKHSENAEEREYES